jgi:hypothetical protein
MKVEACPTCGELLADQIKKDVADLQGGQT